MYISPRQLKLIHYYYFAMGIFSLNNAIFVGFGTLLSYIFLIFYVIFLIISWYIAIKAREQLRKIIILNSKGFFARHVIITVIVSLLSSFIWISGVIPEIEFLYVLTFVNYLVFFMAGMWYMLSKTDFAKNLFKIGDPVSTRDYDNPPAPP